MILFGLTTVTAKEDVKEQVRRLLQAETLQRADAALESVPVTVTAARAQRSAGGIHDFYSEGDYWWANPQDPDGPMNGIESRQLHRSPSCHDTIQPVGRRPDLCLVTDR